MAEPARAIEVLVLGPVTALRGGVAVDLGGARAQTLLALLALRPGSAVSAESLIDQLWAGEAPDAAPTTLRSYVSRLRTALGADVGIERTTAGYVLAVSPDVVDAVRFERAVRDADALMERGRNRRAAAALRAALALWRGEAFAGLASDGALRAEAVRLEELRLHAIDVRLSADLETGRAGELIDEIEAHLAESPFRERLWQLLMLALYRSGRQADALAAYHRARAALDEQLGIEPGPELRELEAAILRQDVPPAEARHAPSGSLPVALTRFVGRARELDEILAILRRARLVTLVGVGGVGKTRLAIEAADRAIRDAVDQAVLVDLAAVADADHVADHVATAVGGAKASGTDPIAAIREAIGTADVVLVLDNCEHVRDAAAALATELLGGAPELRILATSRVALDVAGEAVYPVQPLGFGGTLQDEDDGRASEAVELLLDRATLMRHDLVLDEAAYATAARICRDLDGLPLAIELAAARTKTLSLDEIAERLRDRFQFLVSWRRLSAARHRTLRETMDWSYELLDADARRLLAGMSVFPAGATQASIAAVCLDGDAAETERLIERLVDASMVLPTATPRGTRYRLLETVRQYADEQLTVEERGALQRRHAEHMAALAKSTTLSLETTGRMSERLTASFELARTELPSIRAAIAWCAREDVSLGIELATSLERFWVTNHPIEGAATLTRLVEQDGVSDELRARALRCRGGARYVTGAFEPAVRDYEAALAIHRRLGQAVYEAHLLLRLAIEAHRAGDPTTARALLADSVQIGGADRFVPDAYVGRSLEADLAFDEGRVDESLELQREAGELAAAAGDGWWRTDTLLRLSDRALRSGRPAIAAPAAREALRWARAIADRQSAIYAIAALAWEATASRQPDRAGRLWGGLQAEVERGGRVGAWELEEAEFEALASTDDAAFRDAVIDGRAMSLDEVVELALDPG